MSAAEEARYEQLRRLAQELHVPVPETFWELEVFGRDGKAIQQVRQRSHSWVRNAYNHMFSQLAGKDGNDNTFGAGLLSVRDIVGTVRFTDRVISQYTSTSCDLAGNRGYRAPAGNDSYGILVGSGLAAEDFEDYSLDTQIVDGTGAGELSHISQDAHSITYDPGTRVLANEMVRYFNNNSGGPVDVNEVALVAWSSTPATYMMQARDKLGATVTVPDTGQLKVTYTVQLAYPV